MPIWSNTQWPGGSFVTARAVPASSQRLVIQACEDGLSIESNRVSRGAPSVRATGGGEERHDHRRVRACWRWRIPGVGHAFAELARRAGRSRCCT
jgi:hypothetical protein